MPAYIAELIIFCWRTFKGRTCIAFHDYAGMSAVLGDNGSGKTCLLEAIAFVTCARGTKRVGPSAEVSGSYVALALRDDGPRFRRGANNLCWLNGELLSEQEYEQAVRSEISTFYMAQLMRPRDFFKPQVLARFIECEELLNVETPHLVSLDEFSALEYQTSVEFELWRKARKEFVYANADVRSATKDLAILQRSRRCHSQRARLERRIQLVRHMQMTEAAAEIREKIRVLNEGIQKLETRKAALVDKISHGEVELQRTEVLLEGQRKQLEITQESVDEASQEISACSTLVCDIQEEEVLNIYEMERNEELLRAAEDLYKQKAVTEALLASLARQGPVQQQSGHERDEGVDARSDHESLLSVASECDKIVDNAKAIYLETERHAAKRAQERYQNIIESHEMVKQQLVAKLTNMGSSIRVKESIAKHTREQSQAEASARAIERTALERLKNIRGVLGLLHELVTPESGYEYAFWSVLGEHANLLVVEGQASLLRCSKFLRKKPLSLVNGIVDITDNSVTSLDTQAFNKVRLLCPRALFLSKKVDVEDGPYKEPIKHLATRNAVLVPDVCDYVERYSGRVPAYIYCDTTGLSRTPEGLMTRYNERATITSPEDTAEEPHCSAEACHPLFSDKDQAPDEVDRTSLGFLPSTEIEMLKMERMWLAKRIRTHDERVRKLVRTINSNKEDVVNAVSASEAAPKNSSTAFVAACVAALSGTNLDKNSERQILLTLGLEKELMLRLSVVDSTLERAMHRLKMAREKVANLENSKRREEGRLVELEAKRSEFIEKMRPLFAGHELLQAEVETKRDELRKDRQCMVQIREEDLVPVNNVKDLLVGDTYYIDLARRAIEATLDEAYDGIDDRTRSREEAAEESEGRVTPPETLIRKYEAELEKVPGLLLPTNERAIEEMKHLVAHYTAVQAQANEAQIRALRRLDRVTERLVEMKKSRSARMAANISELTKRASSAYQAIVVGRQAAPRIQRLFLVPLDDADPWKGVMCSCHPVGRQPTPVVQLSNGEMATAELCIKISALAGDGTKLVLYDEVDASLDALTCNALGNFIRKRSGSPGGGQAIMATHKRATYNVAHNLIGVYRKRPRSRARAALFLERFASNAANEVPRYETLGGRVTSDEILRDEPHTDRASGSERASTEISPSAERPSAERISSERPTAERAPTERPTAERPTAERTPAERTPAERTPAERTPAERTPAERTPAERTPAAADAAARTEEPNNGPTVVVTYRRRIGVDDSYERRPARPQNPLLGLYAN